jgi:hypothetical protein
LNTSHDNLIIIHDRPSTRNKIRDETESENPKCEASNQLWPPSIEQSQT